MKTNAERQAAHRASKVTLTRAEALQVLAMIQKDSVIPFRMDDLMSATEKLQKALE